MRIFLLAFAILAVAASAAIDSPFNDSLLSREDTNTLAHIKTNNSVILVGNDYQRRLKHCKRRDISEVVHQYLPPAEETATEAATEVKSAEDTAVLGENGYEYKTLRRLKYRQRRDVSKIVNEYLPPADESATEAVAEIANEYLPSAEESATEAIAEVKTADGTEDTAVLGENGYEYKTIRRSKYRQRRDVSKTASEYLHPVEESATEAVAEVKTADGTEDTAALGENGYEYKTVRRLKYRQRRDISKDANEYLPPVEESATEAVAEVKTADGTEDTAALGENGYEYKTVRRLKYRQRRDVSDIHNEYLPSAEESATEAIAEVKTADGTEDTAVLGENGYEYKTIRRSKYRQRRDVSKDANKYLPPVEESATEGVAVADIANEYLPPAKESATDAVAEVKTPKEPEETAVLGEKGYEYKTVHRLKYRQRRDVSKDANEYLPPVEKSATEALAEDKCTEEPKDTGILGENGYEYKIVRRLKFRHRRDVSEIASEYLSPTEASAIETAGEVKYAEDPNESPLSCA